MLEVIDQYSTVQYSTVQYSTDQFSSVVVSSEKVKDVSRTPNEEEDATEEGSCSCQTMT
jgi:hypothetical protein